MGSKNGRLVLAVGLLVGLAASAATAEAGTIYAASGTSAGYAVSATADVTFGTTSGGQGYVEIALTNTTAVTGDAAQLLTGFSFNISGVTSVATDLDSASAANARTVSSTGSWENIGPVNLLTVRGGGPSWEFEAPSNLRLKFNPDAKYAIIGKPSGAGNDYAGANGSINGNNGHNPFVAETATFRILLNGATAPVLSNAVFWWNTGLGYSTPGTPVVPLPSAAWGGLGLLGALGFVHVLRRRRTELD